MDYLKLSPTEITYINALRQLIRTGATAAPQLETSPLLDLEIVKHRTGGGSAPARSAHIFIEALRYVIQHRLEGNDAQTAAILFGFDRYAGLPLRERYRTVVDLYNPYWTWENFRKEPLTRHLLVVYLALKREGELALAKQSQTSPKVLIVQNITREGPGLLERLLHEIAVDYDIVYLDQGDVFPDPTTYAALVVLGGPDSANDQNPKMAAELQRVRAALDAGIPYLGVCLGLQVATKALGGEVVKSPVKEIGLSTPDGTPYSVSLTNLALTALGKKDPLFLGLRNHFRVFQLHGETVELTPSMQLLAIGQECRNQIVKFNPTAYGIQSHFELTREMLIEWLRADPDLTPLGEEKVLAEFNAIEEAYTLTGLSLLRNFLHIAGLL